MPRTARRARRRSPTAASGFGGRDPERLFEAFHTTKKSGTGLGLAIVRRLVSLQGGTVALFAREGGGAIARIVLPLVRSQNV